MTNEKLIHTSIVARISVIFCCNSILRKWNRSGEQSEKASEAEVMLEEGDKQCNDDNNNNNKLIDELP